MASTGVGEDQYPHLYVFYPSAYDGYSGFRFYEEEPEKSSDTTIKARYNKDTKELSVECSVDVPDDVKEALRNLLTKGEIETVSLEKSADGVERAMVTWRTATTWTRSYHPDLLSYLRTVQGFVNEHFEQRPWLIPKRPVFTVVAEQ